MTTDSPSFAELFGPSLQEATGSGLDKDQAFTGLVDYGLFAEKMPPCFSSEGLSYESTSEMSLMMGEDDPGRLKNYLDRMVHSFTRYQATRDINIPRQMAIPHPESYLVQCLLIKRVWADIKKHCSSSEEPYSRIFVRKLKDSLRVFEMSYRGPERWDQEEAELRFQTGAKYIVHTDVSKCFSSIYSHSISWAMHGKPEAKRNRNLLQPGHLLDRACQVVADSQTNGIHIGPHTSNVISEIVLTKVDSALRDRGYGRVVRYIDDYRFYADTHEEAESFIQEISMQLREYELQLNEGKTRILALPQPEEEEWIRELNAFQFQEDEIAYAEVRRFLDLAVCLVERTGKSSVLNYAIQKVPERLDGRARRMFAQEVMNLTLQYPYLTPVLDSHLFEKHKFDDSQSMRFFCKRLLEIGVKRIYPDAIAFALYYAIRFEIELPEESLLDIIPLDDCISLVLLWEYAERHEIVRIRKDIQDRTEELKQYTKRDTDQYWLLIYQVWSVGDLRGNGQGFLADLKAKEFSFIRWI